MGVLLWARYPCTLGRILHRGASLIRNKPLPLEHHGDLGIVLLWGPRGVLFLMSEVPL